MEPATGYQVMLAPYIVADMQQKSIMNIQKMF